MTKPRKFDDVSHVGCTPAKDKSAWNCALRGTFFRYSDVTEHGDPRYEPVVRVHVLQFDGSSMLEEFCVGSLLNTSGAR